MRYLRTEASMAYPAGRLIAVQGSKAHVLAVDGWLSLGSPLPRRAITLSRGEAEDWCAVEGWSLALLDQLPIE